MIDNRYFSDSGPLYDFPKNSRAPYSSQIARSRLSATEPTQKFGIHSGSSSTLSADWDACKTYPALPAMHKPSSSNLEMHTIRPTDRFSDATNRSINIVKPGTCTCRLCVTDVKGHPHSIGIFRHASALYGILVAITAVCLTLTAHLTHNVDATHARWFDCAMLISGICFLLFSIAFLFRKPKKKPEHAHKNFPVRQNSLGEASSVTDNNHLYDIPTTSLHKRQNEFPSTTDQYIASETPPDKIFHTETDSSSFYMKMGALIFAVGSLIYTSLEIGVFAENESCFNIVMAMQPCCFTVYLMMQLYFIFRTSKLSITDYRYRAVCWFGMIHLAATDFCLWIRILIDETQHEIKLIAEKRHNITEMGLEALAESGSGPNYRAPLCVNEESLMKDMLDKASIFLYPCIIEYALITAGVLITMWKVIGSPNIAAQQEVSSHPLYHSHESQSQLFRYSVDCDQATKGLFSGITTGILSVIMEITLNALGFLTALYCMVIFIKKLRPRQDKTETAESNLENALLMICMIGVYTYSVVSLMGSYMVDTLRDALSVTATLLILLEATVQTVFIIGTGKRCIGSDPGVANYRKPGREALTFLILVNFALWAVDVFCLLRTDSSPTQKEYFGEEQWAVLLHLSVPLVIFFRFHSTVCLVDIWKRAYKLKRRSHPAKILQT
ncbi:proton channel OtopLc-like isoform X2 [Paramacrobiotus metropolitanus]|uniref:proton channel OtopLc-like isoform X2 n=1 Tax=Paramacrobiotus metropolitanus TaxID=2943436 RepID=UPI002445D301|nr:proton channel OtopLc-like isoform X2 [Paramacrobiotus metropolitanus]